ncbi:TetR/AcrR family transcriptional regulator [Nonomuraea sp. NPDC049419]|uniref:TetR/AcrR family transcriptional regulator n=1 Tax=Nonomuraea sp. NPDC049419 TaxID=3155772 RepID=UPI0034447238
MEESSPRRRTGGRSLRVTRAVHQATLAILGEKGINGVSIEGVAARAGVNKTTIYRRWGTRAGLLADALVEGTGRQIPLPDTGTLRGDLVAFALRVRDALVAPGSGGLMTALSAGGVHEELAEVGRRYWEGRLAAVRPLLERAVERKELAPHTDLDALIIRVVGPVWFSLFGPGREADDAFVAQCVDIALVGTTTLVTGVSEPAQGSSAAPKPTRRLDR